MRRKKITIIVPVYGDWDSLSDCIESLQDNIDSNKHRVLLVNDCGPEADVIEENIKKAIKGHAHFTYHRNKKNLGFLKNCNNAVNNLDKTNNDILLLNSDTKVTPGFLDGLQDVLSADAKIGTVSPRSNNATICTVPLSAMSKKGIEKGKSYKLFQKIKDKLPSYNIAPTSHGFCMLIRRSLIKKYGLFDEVFGKGYGEEVDFCQRIRRHGYKCTISNHAYVFHLEARSFSLETKKQMLEENNKIIRARYPGYQKEVRDYIERARAREESTNLHVNINRGGMAKRLVDRIKSLL